MKLSPCTRFFLWTGSQVLLPYVFLVKDAMCLGMWWVTAFQTWLSGWSCVQGVCHVWRREACDSNPGRVLSLTSKIRAFFFLFFFLFFSFFLVEPCQIFCVIAMCRIIVTGWDGKFDPQFLCLCGSTWNDCRPIPEVDLACWLTHDTYEETINQTSKYPCVDLLGFL